MIDKGFLLIVNNIGSDAVASAAIISMDLSRMIIAVSVGMIDG